eukprot:1146857-Pelagomonas_calceolata.AAC.2
MVIERSNNASRILLEAISKGQALPPWTLAVQITLLSRTCKSLKTQQIDQILVVPMRRVTRTIPRYPLRSRGGHGGNKGRSVLARATLPASQVRQKEKSLRRKIT